MGRRVVAQGGRREVDDVDVVYLPEGAVDRDDLDGLEEVLDGHGVVFVSTGVRERSQDPQRLPGTGCTRGQPPAGQRAHRQAEARLDYGPSGLARRSLCDVVVTSGPLSLDLSERVIPGRTVGVRPRR